MGNRIKAKKPLLVFFLLPTYLNARQNSLVPLAQFLWVPIRINPISFQDS